MKIKLEKVIDIYHWPNAQYSSVEKKETNRKVGVEGVGHLRDGAAQY